MVIRDASARDRLIDSTRELLWARGYAATSPRAILDRAGVGQGSMYHYFAGKEQLAAAALEVTARELVDRAEAVLVSDGPALDRLMDYLLRQREVLRGCPIGRMAGDPDVLESPELHGVLAATFERMRVLTVGVIEEGVREGEFAADLEPGEIAEMVLAVVQGGYVLARAAGETAPFDRAVRGAVALLEHVGTGAHS